MEWLAGEHGESFAWLWRASWQGSALILAVLFAQWLFRRQLSPRWRYSLWLLVLVRLALPVTPEAAFSIFNWAKVPVSMPSQTQPSSRITTVAEPSEHPAAQPDFHRPPRQSFIGTEHLAPNTPEAQAFQPKTILVTKEQHPIAWAKVLAILWITGTSLFSLRVLVSCLGLSRKLGHQQPVADTSTRELLEECRTQMNVRQSVQLMEAERLSSPALCGWWRPRLLLPAGLVRQFNRQELRFVFLHELAHVKRRDVAQNWLITALQIVHWFNPLVWLAFHRLRADRELACDALALSFAREEENKHYGETILKLLQGFVQPAPLPGLVGILEDKNQLKHRIVMIAQFRRTRTWSTLAVLLLVTLGLICLTDARTKNPAANDAPPPASTKAAASVSPAPEMKLAALAVSSSPTAPVVPEPPLIPVPDNAYGASILNLSPLYTARFTDAKYRSAGQAVPQGRQVVDGVPFEVSGDIQFYGLTAGENGRSGRNYLKSLTDIRIGQAFTQLHLLHHAMWPGAMGSPIATIVLHYEDGQTAKFVIKYGGHVRDWFRLRYEADEDLSDPDSHIYWRGDHREASQYEATVRMFKTTFNNPRPDAVVRSLDIISTEHQSSYCLTAASLTTKAVPLTPLAPELAPLSRHFDSAIQIEVVDASGKPITNAFMSFSCSTADSGFLMDSAETGPQGTATVPYPRGELRSLDGNVSAPGHTSQNIIFNGPDFPTHYRVVLTAGRNIGGTVLGAEGRPLAGAEISASGYPGEDSDGRFASQSYDHLRAKTDDQGHWQMGPVPEQPVGLALQVDHRDYPPTTFLSDTVAKNLVGERLPVQSLLDGKAVLRLKKGLLVTGTVTDSQQKPVPGARVQIGWYYRVDDTHKATTDANGQFRFTRLQMPGGNDVLTVQAAGFAPAMVHVDPAIITRPFAITLQPPHELIVKVADTNGQPIPGAKVEVTDWENSRSLEWNTLTDARGQAHWTNAPREAVRLSVSHPDFVRVQNFQAQARNEQQEVQITLPKSARITGQVIDAATKQPITTFQIKVGTSWGDSYQWEFLSQPRQQDGRFQITTAQLQPGQKLRVQADGYLPANSDVITNVSQSLNWVLELKRSANISGTVLQPDGTIAPAASVLLAGIGQPTRLLPTGKMSQWNRTDYLVSTDTSGKFKLLPDPDATALVITHPSGFIQLDKAALGENLTIRLQPWGRIEGTLPSKLRTDGQPFNVTLSTLDYSPLESLQLLNEYRTTVDAQGRFTFSNVPPMRLRLMQIVPINSNSWTYSHLDFVEVKSGVTSQLESAKNTRTLTGKIEVTAAPGSDPFRYNMVNLATKPVTPPPNTTDLQAWAHSAEAKAAMAATRYYSVKPAVDGTFALIGVTPGQYTLNVSLRDAADPSDGFGGRTVGQASVQVTVPAGDNETVVTLPPVKVTANPTLKVGSLAPAFDVPDLTDGRVKLADFRGKYVLLDFWATWCGPCRGETPNLVAVYEQFKDHPKFALISLSLDPEKQAPLNYAKDNKMDWYHGFLGSWNDSPVPPLYDVTGIPSIMLIDPSGKIIAMDLRGSAIQSRVAEALAKKP